MSTTTTITCDVCGKATQGHPGGFGGYYAPGWLSVSGLGPIISADLPSEYRAKQPDLCSWVCVAHYAAEKAGFAWKARSEPEPPPELATALQEAGAGA